MYNNKQTLSFAVHNIMWDARSKLHNIISILHCPTQAKEPKKLCLLELASMNNWPTSFRSRFDVRSLCECSKITLFSLSSVILLRR